MEESMMGIRQGAKASIDWSLDRREKRLQVRKLIDGFIRGSEKQH